MRSPVTETRIQVHATNFDGSPHWQHAAWLVSASDGLVITRTEPGLEVAHERGVWVDPYQTRGHYWPDRWYNVIRLEDPSTLRRGSGQAGSGQGPPSPRLNGYYCNVATPVEFDGETLRYVDLQLDVRVFAAPDGSWTHRLMDEEEFEAARERFAYPEDLVARARAAVDELVALIEARSFPFEG